MNAEFIRALLHEIVSNWKEYELLHTTPSYRVYRFYSATVTMVFTMLWCSIAHYIIYSLLCMVLWHCPGFADVVDSGSHCKGLGVRVGFERMESENENENDGSFSISF